MCGLLCGVCGLWCGLTPPYRFALMGNVLQCVSTVCLAPPHRFARAVFAPQSAAVVCFANCVLSIGALLVFSWNPNRATTRMKCPACCISRNGAHFGVLRGIVYTSRLACPEMVDTQRCCIPRSSIHIGVLHAEKYYTSRGAVRRDMLYTFECCMSRNITFSGALYSK